VSRQPAATIRQKDVVRLLTAFGMWLNQIGKIARWRAAPGSFALDPGRKKKENEERERSG